MRAGYLIQNGEVYDGGGGAAVSVDVRVRGEAIADIGPGLPEQGDVVIDATGLLVAPGLVELHAHVFTGMGLFAVEPEQAGLPTGVTTILDTGTSGSLAFPTFHRFVLSTAREDVFALLNISQVGVQGHPSIPPFIGDLDDVRHAHVPSAVACIERFRDRILGSKVRLTAGLAGGKLENEQAGLRGAIEAASRTGLLCMVHQVASQMSAAEVLAALRPGDIYTHCYHPHPDNALNPRHADGPDTVRRARDRGILFDLGHGVGAFAWEIAEPACQQHDFWPDTISSDLHQFNLHGPVFDLPTTMSKLLHLGMPLAHVIRAATQTPAESMRLGDRFGTLRAGRQADITLLRVVRGNFELTDVLGHVRVARERLLPVAVLKRGRYHPCRASSASGIVRAPILSGLSEQRNHE